eukprot:6432752-Amphidinium_carterae.1
MDKYTDTQTHARTHARTPCGTASNRPQSRSTGEILKRALVTTMLVQVSAIALPVSVMRMQRCEASKKRIKSWEPR